MKKAIVTLAVGEKYETLWRDYSEAGWRAYAARHGYDLIVLPELLDRSERGRSRSPAWQKCLVLGPEVAGSYDRVLWLDADIAVNPAAPCVVSGVPVEKIGATDEHRYPSRAMRQKIINGLVQHWTRLRRPEAARICASYLDPAAYHGLFPGVPRRHSHIVQTGVLVLSPVHHRDLFERVYRDFEDPGGAEMNYEMRPMSHLIQEERLAHWLDSRFNALFLYLIQQQQLQLGRFGTPFSDFEAATLARKWLSENYFLHFAGCHGDIAILPRG